MTASFEEVAHNTVEFLALIIQPVYIEHAVYKFRLLLLKYYTPE